MRKFVLAFVVTLFFIACSKEEDNKNLKGDYSGTFTRTDPSGGNAPTANVTVQFNGTNFWGQSGIANYPAICTGSYLLEGDRLKAANTCVFTANFDWTFIFDGDYNYEFDGTNLTIWKEYGNGTKDIYVLTKIK